MKITINFAVFLSTIFICGSASAMLLDRGDLIRKSITIKRTYCSQNNVLKEKNLPTKKLGEYLKERLNQLQITGRDTLETKAKKLKNIKNNDREILTSQGELKKSIECVKRNCYKTFLEKLPNNKVAEQASKIAEDFYKLAEEVFLGKVSKNISLEDPSFREYFVQLGYGWSEQLEKLKNDDSINEIAERDRDELIIAIHNVNVLKYQMAMNLTRE